MRRLTIALFSLIAATMAQAKGAADPRLVGRWYGETFNAIGQFTQWINDRKADGTYSVEFRSYNNCNASGGDVELGTWRYADGRLFQVTTHAGGRETDRGSKQYRDWYRVTSLTSTQMDYIHEKTLKTYSARKVSADFDFPSCVAHETDSE